MAPLKEQAAALLVQLRGPVSKAALARRLGKTRQRVITLERGSVSFAMLDELAAVYGVEFRLVAVYAGDYHRPDGMVAPAGSVCGGPGPALDDLLPER